MLLRTRVTVAVAATCLALVAGLVFAGLKSDELADDRYAQATLSGHELFWRKLVENSVQRLETDAAAIAGDAGLAAAVERGDPTAVLLALGPAADALRERDSIARFEVMGKDGHLLYSTRSLLETASVDAATVRGIVESRKALRGIILDANRNFSVTLAFPLEGETGVAGIAVLAADPRPPLAEFKGSTGADIFLVDHAGKMSVGTDDALWQVFAGKVSARKGRLETREEDGRFYSVAVLPLHDGVGRVIGALVTVRDVTDSQGRQDRLRKLSFAAACGFLVLVLGLFTGYLRRSFARLDKLVAAVSRGDAPADFAGDKTDEIGRIAAAVGVLHDRGAALDLAQRQGERAWRRREVFIRRQMKALAALLPDDSRAAVLADLEDGDFAKLGTAIQTLSDRIGERQRSLQDQLDERTRDLDALREALHTRYQSAEAPLHLEAAEVTIGSDLEELGRLAALVDEFGQRNALPEQVGFNVNLCLDELITTIVSHGYDDDGRRREIHVRLWLDDGALAVRVEDDSQPYDPLAEVPAPTGGPGVLLVKEFMDRAEYRREGERNVVTLWKSV